MRKRKHLLATGILSWGPSQRNEEHGAVVEEKEHLILIAVTLSNCCWVLISVTRLNQDLGWETQQFTLSSPLWFPLSYSTTLSIKRSNSEAYWIPEAHLGTFGFRNTTDDSKPTQPHQDLNKPHTAARRRHRLYVGAAWCQPPTNRDESTTAPS